MSKSIVITGKFRLNEDKAKSCFYSRFEDEFMCFLNENGLVVSFGSEEFQADNAIPREGNGEIGTFEIASCDCEGCKEKLNHRKDGKVNWNNFDMIAEWLRVRTLNDIAWAQNSVPTEVETPSWIVRKDG